MIRRKRSSDLSTMAATDTIHMTVIVACTKTMKKPTPPSALVLDLDLDLVLVLVLAPVLVLALALALFHPGEIPPRVQ